MAPLTSQRVDFSRQWSSSTSRVRSNATKMSRHPTGAAHMNHRMAKTAYWLSLPMHSKKSSCHLLKNCNTILAPKTTITALMELPTHLQSSFSAIFPIMCRCHAIRSCRYGTDRIGSIVLTLATMVQHVLMCMRGMLKITWASDLSGTNKVLKWCKFHFKEGAENVNVNTAHIYPLLY